MSRLTYAVLAAFSSAAWVMTDAAPQAFAQTAQLPGDLAAPARQAVSQVLYASTATSAAAERALDAHVNEQRRAIEGLRARLTAAGGRNETLAAELSAAQDRYCAELAERDRAYAHEIAILRGAVEDIAATSEGAAALERFNAGDELGALFALDRLRDARERARRVRNNIESAAEGRDIATLALEARNRGRLETAAVVARYEEVTSLDPGVHRDWVELAALYREGGRLTEALAATARGLSLNQSDEAHPALYAERGEALMDLGSVDEARIAFQASLDLVRRAAQASPQDEALQQALVIAISRLVDAVEAQGDLVSASALAEESVAIARRLSEVDPSDVALQLARYHAEQNAAGVQMLRGDFIEARSRLEDCLRMVQQLVRVDPESSALIRALAESQLRIGELHLRMGDFSDALVHYEGSLALSRRLAQADASNVYLQQAVLSSEMSLGDLYSVQGNQADARSRYQAALAIAEQIIARDPSSARLQYAVYSAQVGVGNSFSLAGDHAGALPHFEAGLRISLQLSGLDPSNYIPQSYVSLSHGNLGDTRLALRDFAGAREHYEERLRINQILALAAPTNANRRQVLAFSFTGLARLMEWQGDISSAVAYQTRATEISRQLAREFPSNSEFAEELQYLERYLSALQARSHH